MSDEWAGNEIAGTDSGDREQPDNLRRENEQSEGEQAGNPEPAAGEVSFAELVHEHWPAVYRMLVRVTGQRHDAEDLAQETFLRAMTRQELYRAGTNLRAWLLRIASNAFLDQKRKQLRVGMRPLAVDPETSADDVGRAIEVAEESALAKAALEELPEITRLIFHLRVQEDMPFREIGEIVGLNENAARQHMFQARAKLLRRLEG